MHFIHKTIKEVPFISRVPGHWNHKLFLWHFGFLVSKASTSAWCMITDTISLSFLFCLRKFLQTRKNARTEAHFFRCYFFVLSMIFRLAARWKLNSPVWSLRLWSTLFSPSPSHLHSFVWWNRWMKYHLKIWHSQNNKRLIQSVVILELKAGHKVIHLVSWNNAQ